MTPYPARGWIYSFEERDGDEGDGQGFASSHPFWRRIVDFFFLVPVFWVNFIETHGHPLVSAGYGAILVLLLVGEIHVYRELRSTLRCQPFEVCLIRLAICLSGSVFGAVATYFANHTLGLGAVIAASLVGLLGACTPALLRHKNANLLPLLIYCGAFIGMSSMQVLDRLSAVAQAGLVAGFIFWLTQYVYEGFGGKLGTIAFGAVLLTTLLLGVVYL